MYSHHIHTCLATIASNDCNISLSLKIGSRKECQLKFYVHWTSESNKFYSWSINLLGGTPLLILVNFLGVGAFLGVENLFCNAGGIVGMASAVLVVGPFGWTSWNLWINWSFCLDFRNCRNGILFAWRMSGILDRENVWPWWVEFLAFLSNNSILSWF